MNVHPVYRQLVALGKPQLAIRSSSTSVHRGSHSRAAISTNFRASDHLARTPSLAPKRTISLSSLKPNARKRGPLERSPYGDVIILIALALGYSIYKENDIVGKWPKEVRNDLRAAVKAKHKGDWRMAASLFERAYDTAVTLPDQVASFGADSAIKISAIALSLADVLESAGDLPRAYSVYGAAFAELIKDLPSLSESNTALEADQRRRAIGIAVKMAELGEHILHKQALGIAPKGADYGPTDKAEVKEKFDWALTEALRLRNTSVQPPDTGKKEEDTLNLPEWVKKVDLTSIMTRVGEYYMREGEIEYAAPLGLYIISTLAPLPLPPSSFHYSSTPYMDVIVSFNVGTLSEMSNEIVKAQAYYEHALEVSKSIGMDEGARMAQYALNRLKSQSQTLQKENLVPGT